MHDELRVDGNVDIGNAACQRKLEPGDDRGVLGDVIGRFANSSSDLPDHLAVLVGEEHPDPRRTWIAARASVGVQSSLHGVR